MPAAAFASLAEPLRRSSTDDGDSGCRGLVTSCATTTAARCCPPSGRAGSRPPAAAQVRRARTMAIAASKGTATYGEELVALPTHSSRSKPYPAHTAHSKPPWPVLQRCTPLHMHPRTGTENQPRLRACAQPGDDQSGCAAFHALELTTRCTCAHRRPADSEHGS